jgi:hypothetical protein
MTEKIFNLFLYVDKGIITEIGAIMHEISGSDYEKKEFMKSRVHTGAKKNVRFLVPSHFKVSVNGRIMQGVHYETYKRVNAIGAANRLFEEIYEHYEAPSEPLKHIATVIDGVILEEEEVANVEYACFIS